MYATYVLGIGKKLDEEILQLLCNEDYSILFRTAGIVYIGLVHLIFLV